MTDKCLVVLDPVMGDQGRLYVNEDVVPMYKKTIQHADLILPNQFEAEYETEPFLVFILLPSSSPMLQ